MKMFRILLAVSAVFVLCSAFTLKDKDKEKVVYAFGLAASFNDTVVYCTEIQVLDSVRLDRNGFLPMRELYSYQLKDFISYQLHKPDYTCMIYFSENRDKLLKEAGKLKKNYEKAEVNVQTIEAASFQFKKPEE